MGIGSFFKKVGGGFKKAGVCGLKVATSQIGMMTITKVLPKEYRALFALGKYLAGELDRVPRMPGEDKKKKLRADLERQAKDLKLPFDKQLLNTAVEDCILLHRGQAFSPGMTEFVPRSAEKKKPEAGEAKKPKPAPAPSAGAPDAELLKLVAKLDLTDSKVLKLFKKWKDKDGTKEGLEKIVSS